MKQDHTDITIVLDRSGSMQSVREDTIGGYNSFVESQAKLPGHASISLVQFDDQYEVVYAGVDCKAVKPMRAENFVPRGSTAMLDAIGRTINATGARLAAMAEADRPAKVVMVVLTDGEENASKEFTRAQVKMMVTRQRELYSWEFVFLGANQDAIFTAATIGVPAASSLSYAADAKGTEAVFASTSAYLGNVRSCGVGSFEAEDRIKQQRS
jgi:hypothetical protein